MANYCMICGHELILEDNQMLSDMTGDHVDPSDDNMVTLAHCPNCNLDYDMIDASNSDALNRPSFVGSCTIYRSNEEENIITI